MAQCCSRCHSTNFWKLKDGRLKCRSCGEKYRWKAVWEGSRLSQEVKVNVLKLFISGIPASRMNFRQVPSLPTRERFIRLIRATLAYEENFTTPFCAGRMNGYALAGAGYRQDSWPESFHDTIVLGVTHVNQRIQLVPLNNKDEASKAFQLFAKNRTPPGVLSDSLDSTAYIWFQLRHDYLLFPKAWSLARTSGLSNRIEDFWECVQQTLSPYKSLPKKVFHLYLSECAYRFNHQGEELFSLIYDLLHKTALTDIQSIAFPKS